MDPFTTDLKDPEKEMISRIREEITKHDELVTERVGKIMSVDRAFVYNQDDVFKYGIARTKHHYSFHSMVMYAFPEVAEFAKKNVTGSGIKFQKGCINFTTLENFPMQAFSEMMALSSQQDFRKVIKHYKN